jgi:hypothetical protein
MRNIFDSRGNPEDEEWEEEEDEEEQSNDDYVNWDTDDFERFVS